MSTKNEMFPSFKGTEWSLVPVIGKKIKANNDFITKHRGMSLYLCRFEFTSGEFGQTFSLLFYARNTRSLEQKVDKYLRGYYPDTRAEIDGRKYLYCGGAVMVEFDSWTEIMNAQQLINEFLAIA